MQKEYYWQFMLTADLLVERFIKEAEERYADCFTLNDICLKKAISNYLWEKIFFSNSRYSFSKSYKNEESRKAFISFLWEKYLLPLLPEQGSINVFRGPLKSLDRKYAELLKPFRSAIIFYCKNNRLLKYILPVANEIGEQIVILTFEELDENLIEKDHIQIIEMGLFKEALIKSKGYITEKLPYISSLSKTLDVLLSILQPKSVVLIEGCHFDSEIIAAICRRDSVKTVCLQHGWPGLIHTRFMNMGYDYYLTWGKMLSEAWQIYNPQVRFIEAGYIHTVKKANHKTGITFFFQGELFIIDQLLLKSMMYFAIHCAREYPNRTIYLRQHPEAKLPPAILKKALTYKNVKLADSIPINELFSMTEIGVAVFSTTLLEGLAHNTIPFIFNPTSWPCYYPNLAAMGVGMEVKSLASAKKQMAVLVQDTITNSTIKERIHTLKDDFFACTGKTSVLRISRFITSLDAAP